MSQTGCGSAILILKLDFDTNALRALECDPSAIGGTVTHTFLIIQLAFDTIALLFF